MFFLDRFPEKILNIIFDYLWLNEIVFSLLNVSSSVSSSINNYHKYYLHFRYLNKSSLDLILKSFQSQIHCLVWSLDHSVGPFAQLNELLVNYSLEDFVRLEKLNLIDFNEQSSLVLLSNLSKLNSLKCLRLDRMPTYIGSRFIRILPRLKRLDLPDASLFDRRSGQLFTNVNCLTIRRCSFQQFEHLFNILPQQNLRSLVINETFIDRNQTNCWPSLSRYPQQLTRLHLQIDIIPMTMIELKQFVSQLKCLTHLNLKAEGDVDLVDGRQWEQFLSQTFADQLKEFDFCFTIDSYVDLNLDELIENYSRSFWLNRRRPWYICYNGRGLMFTIPFYALQMTRSDEQFNCRTTMNNSRLFYDQIRQLKIFNETHRPLFRFEFVKDLRMEFESCHSTYEQIQSIVNIEHVQHLQILIQIPFAFLNSMTHLIHLSLVNVDSLHSCLHKVGWNNQFKQIRILEINYNKDQSRWEDIQPERLCRLFPNVNRLTIDGINLRRTYLFRIIDALDRLTYAKFQINWTKQDQANARHEFQRSTARLISNSNQTNFHFNFQTFFVHLFISKFETNFDKTNQQENKSKR